MTTSTRSTALTARPWATSSRRGRSGARKALRFITDVDQFLTHPLAFYDASSKKVAALTRPAKLFKSRLLVDDGYGRRVRGRELARWDFSVTDATGIEVARIDKKLVGLAKAVSTNADNYVVDNSDAVQGDFRLMVVAAATAVDIALKRDPGKLGVSDAVDLCT